LSRANFCGKMKRIQVLEILRLDFVVEKLLAWSAHDVIVLVGQMRWLGQHTIHRALVEINVMHEVLVRIHLWI